MRDFLAFLSIAFTLAILAAGGTVFWAMNAFKAPGPLLQERLFVVESGQGVSRIAANLYSETIIDHPLLFRLAARAQGADKKIRAGEYLLPAQASMKGILRKFVSGDVFMRKFTIPEGRTTFEIVDLLNAVPDIEGEAVTEIPAEGSLLPETYRYSRADTRARKIEEMKKAMSDVLAALWPGRDQGLPFSTPEEAVTLASIVEKETGVAAERNRIAGVFINRLRKGIPLQSDPTVIYALNGGRHDNNGMGPLGRRLLSKDLETDSPYNTYKNAGLPPGPIANPGVASLDAVLHPEQHDFIYFVADGTGGHVFAATLEEHNANVAKWRRIRKDQERAAN